MHLYSGELRKSLLVKERVSDRNQSQSRSIFSSKLLHLLFIHLESEPDFDRNHGRIMKGLILWLVLLLACQSFGSDHLELARVTVYWNDKRSGANAAWNGARLHETHCAVDPKKIPYGSKVVFDDTECIAVDSGPDVVNRKAARWRGRNAAERNAIVIDRFFETKDKALAWARVHPDFIMIRVRTPDTELSN
jgi:3D (Asp-Asp-Asp) domain-containing protein